MLAIYAMSVASNMACSPAATMQLSALTTCPSQPHRTTTHHHAAAVFTQVCDELIAMLVRVLQQEPGPRHVPLPPRLIVRETT